jgi:hypothetical protein
MIFGIRRRIESYVAQIQCRGHMFHNWQEIGFGQNLYARVLVLQNWVLSPLRRGERYSMEELAQSVGNENIPGDFDWDAATAVDPNTNDAGPFQHLVDSNPALGREEACVALSQRIAQLPLWAEESFSDALSRAYTIVRDSSLHRCD